MMNKSSSTPPPLNPAKVKLALDILAFPIDIFAGLILAAAIFSWPFPFVRQIWVQEVLGLTGIINAVILVVIGRSMKHLSLVAPFAGLGLVFSEITILSRSFVFLYRVSKVEKGDLCFFTLSLAVILVLAVLFWSGFCRIYSLYQSGYHPHHHHHDPLKVRITGAPKLFLPFIVSSTLYVILIAAVLLCRILSAPLRFAGLKFIAEAACIVAAAGCAAEMGFFIRGEQSKYNTLLKAVIHILISGVLLLFLYKQISFQGFLV